MISFLIVLYRRKIEDFYLRSSIIFLVSAMALRTLMCIIIIVAIIKAAENDWGGNLLEAKLQVIQFSIPYYFFFLVTVSLLFSAHTFYVGLRNVFFPQLRENDDQFRPVKLNQIVRVSTRKRFRASMGTVILMLTIFCLMILAQNESHEEGVPIFSGFEKFVLWSSWGTLYAFQCVTFIIAIVLLKRLVGLNLARPQCAAGICTEKTQDDGLCDECSQLIGVLRQRLPTILKCFIHFFAIFLCQYVLYTYQRCLNIFESREGTQSIFVTDTIVIIIQICLELIQCITIFIAICYA